MYAADPVIAGASDRPTHKHRHIDYAIVIGVFPTGWTRNTGRDHHDLISYEFDVDRISSARKSEPFRKLEDTEKATAGE